VGTLVGTFPRRGGDNQVQHRLNQLAHVYPPPIVWLLLGSIGIAIRRPRGSKVMALLALAALTIVVFNALAQSSDPRYMLPVAPAFVLLAAGALLGPRERASGKQAAASSAVCEARAIPSD